MKTEVDSPILADGRTPAPTPTLTLGAVLDRRANGDAGGRALTTLAAPGFALPLIALIGGLLFVVNLGGYPLYTKGEPREAVTVFDIVHGGGLILPMRAGVELPSKPLLMHWLAGLVAIVAGGVNEWTVRLPSALCAIGGTLACYVYVRRLYDQRAGLVAALILGTTFQYLQAGRGARVDMTLTFLLELAFFEFILIAEGLSRRITFFYLTIALAVLTKGPIGIALPLMVAGTWTVLYRRWELFRTFDLKRGALIVGIIGGGWYLAAIIAGGSAFIHKQLLAENLYRLLPEGAGYVGHHHPFYYEEGALIGGFMPWTPIAGLAGAQVLRGSRRIDRRFGYLLVWFLVVLIFYNLPQSKRGVYLLALYPALSALVAILLVDMLDSGRSFGTAVATLARLTGVALATAAALALSGLAILYFWPTAMVWLLGHFAIALPELAAQLRAAVRAQSLVGLLLGVGLASLGISLMRSECSLARLVACTAAGCVLMTLAANVIIEPAIARSLSLKQFAADTRRIADGASVGYFGNLDYDFAFYNGRDLRLTTPLDPTGPALLVSPEEDWKLVAPRLRDNYTVVLRSHPTDPDGSGRMLLLRRQSPAPSATSKITT
jgi:4-amino-4-deoxy-L-arabinose transferase-like glycosyltransferase